MRDVVLTGFMGVGKSTVGRIIADRYGLPFVDTDEEIARLAGASIPVLFETMGESGFRRLEFEALAGLMSGEGRVIATGGGALVNPENLALLGSARPVLCLTCPVEELGRRLNDRAGRPLLTDTWPALLESRRDAYADFEQVDTGERTPVEVADDIASRLQLDELGDLEFQPHESSVIHFGRGLATRPAAWYAFESAAATALLVTDSRVASLGIADRVAEALRGLGVPVHCVTLPEGEATKSLQSLERLYGECLAAGLDRQGLVVGVGGGMIGDLAGMLAATFMRGVQLALVPTTLLAQVDASIGGKVGVDACGTKNLAGAFHPAGHVVIDPDFLATLPRERLADGLAEVVKIAMMRSRPLLDRLEALEQPEDILRYPEVVRRAAAEKIAVVASDPFEKGERALLNFGHTVGHGIEAASGYRVSHGQAVAAGMIAEAGIGEGIGETSAGIRAQLVSLAERFHLPISIPEVDASAAFDAMLSDKKRRGGVLHMAVPRVKGAGALIAVSDDVAQAGLRSVLESNS